MEYRFPIVRAITWTIICEILRRHQKKEQLRLLETHPGGGQYDCLTINSGDRSKYGRHLCDFNILSNRLHIWHKGHRVFEYNQEDNYVSLFLSSEDPKILVDQIELEIGLLSVTTKRISKTTPSILPFRVITDIMQHGALRRKAINAECGWFDSSGYDGSYARRELFDFPDIKTKLIEAKRNDSEFDVSSQFWILSGEMKKVILDMDGNIWEPSCPDPISLWKLYLDNNRDLMFVSNWVYRLLI